jgi:predicted dehydrogenase
MANKVRLGLVGCGGFMRAHVGRLAAVRAARIEALVEPSKRNLKRFLGHHPELADLPTFGSHSDMLQEVELDGMVIASPHSSHYEQIMDALGHGVHVLTEKPMVDSVQQAKAVIRKAKRKDLVLMIGYQRHYFPAFRLAREMLTSGKLGRITFVAALQAQDWLRGTKGTWRQDPALSSGGQLNDSGSHLLDALLWLTDLKPDVVCAQIDNRGSKVDILSALTVRFRGGAIGTIAVVGDAPGWWEDVTFYGEDGSLYIRDNRLILQTRARSGGVKSQDITDRLRYKGDPDKNFVDSIRGEAEPQTPAVCGLRVAQLTEAAWESARLGKPVKVKR